MENQPLTQEQRVIRGELAGRYLDDPQFMGFINEMMADRLICIGNTEPEDEQTRKKLYFEHRGLSDLLAHLATYRQTAQQITAADDDIAGDEPEVDTD